MVLIKTQTQTVFYKCLTIDIKGTQRLLCLRIVHSPQPLTHVSHHYLFVNIILVNIVITVLIIISSLL